MDEGRTVYGINTGFGKFCRVLISPDKLQDLQFNLITSHACGVGPDLSPQRARTLMALRINVLAKAGIHGPRPAVSVPGTGTGNLGPGQKNIFFKISDRFGPIIDWYPD